MYPSPFTELISSRDFQNVFSNEQRLCHFYKTIEAEGNLLL